MEGKDLKVRGLRLRKGLAASADTPAAVVPAIDPRRDAIRCGHHSQVVNVDPPLDTVLPVVLYVLALLLMVVGGTLGT